MSTTTDKIRNVGLFGHSGSGKSSLAEAMLFAAGVTTRMGKTDSENLIMDYDPDEKKKKVSINAALASFDWKNHRINVLDTPGYDEYIGEVLKAMRVVDTAIVTVSADGGVEVGTDRVWEYLEATSKARIVIINRMDRDNADYDKVFGEIKESLSVKCMPLQIPIGKGGNFQGIIDLVANKALYFTGEEGKQIEEKEIPADMADAVASYREKMIEGVTETDDELMMKYLEGEELTPEEIMNGMKTGIKQGIIYPILCSSATRNIGTVLLLEELLAHCPSPAEVAPEKSEDGEERAYDVSAPFSAITFKMANEGQLGDLVYVKIVSGKAASGLDVFNTSSEQKERIGSFYSMQGNNRKELTEAVAGDIVVMVKLKSTGQNQTLCDTGKRILFPPIQFPPTLLSMAITPKTKADSDKMSTALNRVAAEDPTLIIKVDEEFAQTLLSGMGVNHLEMAADKMKKKYNVECLLVKPRIRFRETITKPAQAQGRHKKQSGGRGQFGDCHLKLEPNPGKGFEYIDKVVGGSVPRQFIPAVEKGVVETMVRGVVAGYPVIDVATTIYDGSYHDVDSSEMAFKMAGSIAFRKAFADAGAIILEPINNVEIKVPSDYMGDVMGDLSSRRGRPLGMEPSGKYQIIKAQVPESEMYMYVTDLKAMTQGRGAFTMDFSHYEQVPGQLEAQLKEEYAKLKEED